MGPTRSSGAYRTGSVKTPVRCEVPQVDAFPTELGPYRLIRELGSGGMGSVVLVEDRRDGAERALKWVPRGPGPNDTAARRHRREYRLLASIDHPAILPVHDFGELGGVQFYTAEFLRGPELDLSGDLAPATWLRPLLQALEFLHTRGWVHGDLKPQHVMFRDDAESCCLIDFGLAKSIAEPTDTAVLGTVHYMPPERFHGESLGVASDLYSVGVILYELLTGRLPFVAERKLEVIHRIIDGRFERVGAVCGDVDPRLASLVDGLLAAEPSARPGSVEAVRATLREVWADEEWGDGERELCAYVASDPLPLSFDAADPSGDPLEVIDLEEKPVALVGAKKAIDSIASRRRLLPILRTRGYRDVELATEGFTARRFVSLLARQEPGIEALSVEADRVDAVREARVPPTPSAWNDFIDAWCAASRSGARFAMLLDARALESGWLVSLIDACLGRPRLAVRWVVLDTWSSPRLDVVEVLERWQSIEKLDVLSIPEANPIARRLWFVDRFGDPGLPESVEELLEAESKASLGRLELLLRGLIESGVVGRERGAWFTRGPSEWRQAVGVDGDEALLAAIVAIEGSDAADLRTLSAVQGQPISQLSERLESFARDGRIRWDRLSGGIVVRDASLRQHLRATVPSETWKKLHDRAARWVLSTDFSACAANWERTVYHQWAAGAIDELWDERLKPEPGRLLADRPATAKAWLETVVAVVRDARDSLWLAEQRERLRFEVGPVQGERVRIGESVEPTAELTARWALLRAAGEPTQGRARELVAAIRPLDRRDPLRHESLLVLLEILSAEGQRPPRDLWVELERLRAHAGPRSLALEFELRMSRAVANGHPAAARDHGRVGVDILRARPGARSRAWRVYLEGRLHEAEGDYREACAAYELAVRRFRPLGDYRGLVRALLRWLTGALTLSRDVSTSVWIETELWVDRLGGPSEFRWWRALQDELAERASARANHGGPPIPA